MTAFSLKKNYYELWWLISQAQGALEKLRARELRRHGITPWQASILFLVGVLGNEATPVNMSRFIQHKPHSVSELLTRMAKQGLIRKVRDLSRKNQVRVELTEKGEEARSHVCELSALYQAFGAAGSNDECRRLKASLQAIRDFAIKELGEQKELPFPYEQK